MNAIDSSVAAYNEFKKLVEQFGIKTIVETGTYYGNTVQALNTLCNNIYSVEIDTTLYNHCMQKMGGNHEIKLFNMPTSAFLKQEIKNFIEPVFFFLDAHEMKRDDSKFHEGSVTEPLLDELNIIAESGMKPIIAIHDMEVPNCYGGYKLEWFKKHLDKIYGEDGWSYYYNVPGENVGMVYILPK